MQKEDFQVHDGMSVGTGWVTYQEQLENCFEVTSSIIELPDAKFMMALALDAFNKKMNAYSRVENVLMPIRDGLMVVRKK